MTPENWTPEMISNFNRTADDMADDTDPVKSAGGEPSGQPIAASPPSLAARKFALPPLADSQEAMEGIGSDGEINSATPPVCPTCHDTRDTDVPCSNAFHIASLDAPAETALDLEAAIHVYGEAVAGSVVSLGYPTRPVDEARQALREVIANLKAESHNQGVQFGVYDFADYLQSLPRLSERVSMRDVADDYFTDVETCGADLDVT